MNNHALRNAVPPLYGVLVLAGFLVGATVGLVVLVAGGMLSGLLWSMLSGPTAGGGHDRDRSARAQRRAGRR